MLTGAGATAATAAAPDTQRRFHWKRLSAPWSPSSPAHWRISSAGNIRGWFEQLWDAINDISIDYLLAAVALKTVQTTATARLSVPS